MHTLDERSIAAVPESAGAYRLLRDGAVIFIGISLDLRAMLAQHRRGEHGECTRGTTAFEFEVSADPVKLQRRWLAEHAARNGGRLPECNEAGRGKPARGPR
jgi:hypothetical protein